MVIIWEVSIINKLGVLSNGMSGVMVEGFIIFLITLQYSITPMLRLSKTFVNLKFT